VTQPLLLSETQTLNLSLTWDYTISNESLLGQPFSFQLGYVNGHAQSAAVRAGLDWTMRTEEQVLSLHGVVSQGLPILGATNQQIAPNANFTTVLGQAQYVAKINESLQFVGRVAGQIATQPLYPFEQFAIGGPSTVRGYVQNALVRDDAAIGSIELRRSLFRLPIPLVSNAEKDGAVSIDGFMEGGRGWNYRGSPPGAVVNGIASVGVGMRWEIGAGLVAHVDCAWGFIRPQFPQPVPFLQPVSFAVVAQF
jgi:hemolysin activation/secretion protein